MIILRQPRLLAQGLTAQLKKAQESVTQRQLFQSIRGRAWITGTHQLMCDPDDPWPSGYRLTDTWPKQKKLK